MRRALIALVLLFPLLASCTGDDGGGGEDAWEPCEVTVGDIGHPTGREEVVLRMGYGGGLPPPTFMPDELPDLMVYGNGRVLVADQASPFPTPVMLKAVVEEPVVQRMLHAVERTCSLERDWTLEADVYDVGGFGIETTTDAGTRRTFVVGLGFADIAESIPQEQEEQRAALLALDADLRSIAAEADLAPYDPDELGVFFEPIEGDQAAGIASAPWPLEDDLATFGEQHPDVPTVRCGTVEGEDIGAVVDALQPDADGNVPALKDGGTLFQVVTRPMLPGESDCLSLIA